VKEDGSLGIAMPYKKPREVKEEEEKKEEPPKESSLFISFRDATITFG